MNSGMIRAGATFTYAYPPRPLVECEFTAAARMAKSIYFYFLCAVLALSLFDIYYVYYNIYVQSIYSKSKNIRDKTFFADCSRTWTDFK